MQCALPNNRALVSLYEVEVFGQRLASIDPEVQLCMLDSFPTIPPAGASPPPSVGDTERSRVAHGGGTDGDRAHWARVRCPDMSDYPGYLRERFHKATRRALFDTLVLKCYHNLGGETVDKKRIQVYADPETKRRIELAAARRDVAVTQYWLEAVLQQLVEDDMLERELIEIPIKVTTDDDLIADLRTLHAEILAYRGGEPLDIYHELEKMREERDYELTGLR